MTKLEAQAKLDGMQAMYDTLFTIVKLHLQHPSVFNISELLEDIDKCNPNHKGN